jgi:predicted glycoside hydrolase/deacetylase ChbG (UPF0249 family)
MRRLIINADDLGLTAGVNRGIGECIRGGIVTSATLMANAASFADAVGVVRELGAGTPAAPNPTVSVGVHVMLVDGTPLLLPRPPQTGEFPAGFAGVAYSVFRKQVDPGQIAEEIHAQIGKVQAAGVPVSHVDTHKHVHLLPAVLKPLLRAARACGIRAVRNPFAPLKPMAFAHLLRRPHLWKRYVEVKLLRGWLESFRRTVAAEGMVTTDGTFGIVATGALDLELFRAIAGCIPEGTWELCCHPGYNDADLGQVRTRLRQSRDREREILTSPAAREVLAQHQIQLINYWEL